MTLQLYERIGLGAECLKISVIMNELNQQFYEYFHDIHVFPNTFLTLAVQSLGNDGGV